MFGKKGWDFPSILIFNIVSTLRFAHLSNNPEHTGLEIVQSGPDSRPVLP